MDASKPYDGSANIVEEIRCDSAEEFLKAIAPKWDEIKSPDFSDLRVYRGHNDAGWELLPAAWRKDGKERLAPLREWLAPHITEKTSQHPQAKSWSAATRESYKNTAIQVASEVYAVRRFCDLADELGLLIPQEGEVPELGSLISQVSLGYVSQGNFLRQIELFSDIPFAFAQHHGIPTRYFDWTRDPFVAAYFAAEDSNKPKTSKDICVWTVDLTEMPKMTGYPPERTPPLHWVRVPRGQHGFVHAQSGVFLFCGRKGQYDQPWSELPHLSKKKYLLDRGEAEELRKHLYGIHRYSKAHLMPTLDNVSKTVTETWNWLSP